MHCISTKKTEKHISRVKRYVILFFSIEDNVIETI